MTEIVINACYGGFSLSPEGDKAYLALRGDDAFFYVEDRSSGVRPGERDYVRVSEDEARDAFMYVTVTRDLGGRVSHDVMWPAGKAHKTYFNSSELDRDDERLVTLVKRDAAAVSGTHASLKVVEIPDGVAWEIEEYDGIEWVAESHRKWS